MLVLLLYLIFFVLIITFIIYYPRFIRRLLIKKKKKELEAKYAKMRSDLINDLIDIYGSYEAIPDSVKKLIER
jgi:hypothetical protein